MARYKIITIENENGRWYANSFSSYNPKIKYSLENAVRNKSGWFGIYNSLNQSLIIFRGDCFSYAPTNSIDIFKLIEPVAEIFNRMRYIGIGVKWEDQWVPCINIYMRCRRKLLRL